MTAMGRYILLAGLVLVAVGALLWLLGRLGFRGLPGDIVYESDSVRVYVPIVTCLVLSAAATLALWLWHWFTR